MVFTTSLEAIFSDCTDFVSPCLVGIIYTFLFLTYIFKMLEFREQCLQKNTNNMLLVITEILSFIQVDVH